MHEGWGALSCTAPPAGGHELPVGELVEAAAFLSAGSGATASPLPSAWELAAATGPVDCVRVWPLSDTIEPTSIPEYVNARSAFSVSLSTRLPPSAASFSCATRSALSCVQLMPFSRAASLKGSENFSGFDRLPNDGACFTGECADVVGDGHALATELFPLQCSEFTQSTVRKCPSGSA